MMMLKIEPGLYDEQLDFDLFAFFAVVLVVRLIFATFLPNLGKILHIFALGISILSSFVQYKFFALFSANDNDYAQCESTRKLFLDVSFRLYR